MVSSRKLLAVAAVLLLGGGAALGPGTPASAGQGDEAGHGGGGMAAPRQVISAYFADWDVYGRGYFVKDIPADRLNVIQYAFGVPAFDAATGTPGCTVLDPWADYQQVYWTADNTVDGVADDPNNPDQHLFGNFNQLAKLKAAHPGLKIEISLGGWTKSTWFASVAATPQRRQAFVTACIDTFIKGNLPGGGWPAGAGGVGAAAGLFDGIDLDWEYPTQAAGGNVGYGPADRHNATLLAAEFRRQLDELGAITHRNYLLTAALPAARNATAYYELAEFTRYLDWANVMTYDFNVPGGTVAAPDTLFRSDPRDPHAADPTWNTVGTVAWYLAHGVPASKIVVGVPFYGNQYLRAPGLYRPFDNTGLDPNSLQWDQTPQPTYHDLVDVAGILTSSGTVTSSGTLTSSGILAPSGERSAAGGGYARRWNGYAGEPYLTNPAAVHALAGGAVTAPTVIVYSDPASVGERAELVRALGLRGAMAWEISQDSDSHALISALAPIRAPGE